MADARVHVLIAATDRASPVLREVSGSAERTGSALRGIGAAAAVGLGALAGLGAVVGTVGFQFNAMRQQAEVAFTTMLGSGERARSFLDELQRFAAATPFEFPDLVTASQRLLAMGIASSQVIPTLTAIGDAVAALGGGSALVDRVTTAIGQMHAKGRASAEEMRQLTEAGIPAWQMLADAIGVSVPEAMRLVSQGAVDSETAVTAVLQGMSTAFGGMMAQQSQTFTGVLSTLKDTFSQLAGTVMAPFFAQATAGLQRLAAALSDPEIQAGAQRLAATIAAAGARLGDLAATVLPPVRAGLLAVVDAVRDHWPQIQATAEAVFAALQVAVAAVTPGLRALGEDVVAAVRDHWPQIQATVEVVAAAIATVVRAVAAVAVAEFARVRAWWDEDGQQIAAAARAVFETVRATVQAAVEMARALWAQFGDEIIALTRSRWETVRAVIAGTVQIVTNMISLVAALLTGDWAGAWDAAGDIVRGAAAVVTAIVAGLVRDIAILVRGIGAALGDLGGLLIEAGRALIAGLIAGVRSMAGEAAGAVLETVTGALDAVRARLRIGSPSLLWAQEVGVPIAEGIAAGIRAGAAGVVAATQQVVDAALTVAAAGVAAVQQMMSATPVTTQVSGQGGSPIKVMQTANFKGILGLIQQIVQDEFGTTVNYSVPGWLLEQYGGNLEALMQELLAGKGPFKTLGSGGWLTEPVLGVGLRSGRGYQLAERGPELVTPAGAGAGVTVHVHGPVVAEDLPALLVRGLREAQRRGLGLGVMPAV